MTNHEENAGMRLILQGSSSTLGPKDSFFYTNDVNSTQKGFPPFYHGVVFSVACGSLKLETSDCVMKVL